MSKTDPKTDQKLEARGGSNRRLLPPFAALRAFEAIGALGGIRRAAAELAVDHAAVSRHLRALEDWAGVKLVDRTRGGHLTAEGERYHARISAAFDEIGKATADLTRRGDDRRLLIWCVPGFAYRWLNGRLAEFSAANPDIDLEVRPTDHAPDFSLHQADADIRYVRDFAPPVADDIQTLEFARPVVFPVGAPSYIADLGKAAPTAALLDKILLHEEDDEEWRAWLAERGVPMLDRVPGPRLWHAHLTLDAARRGQGLALTNSLLLAGELESGVLARCPVALGEPEIGFGAYAFRARRDRWRDRNIVRFRRWLQQAAQRDAPELIAAE